MPTVTITGWQSGENPSSHISEVQKEENIALQSRWTLAVYLSVAVLGVIVAEPWIGVGLIVLALGGIVSAVIIRKVNSGD